MTNIGKLLVLFNLCLSLIFTAFAVMVWNTRLDLNVKERTVKAEVKSLTDKKSELTEETNNRQEELDQHKAAGEKAKEDNLTVSTRLKNEIESLARRTQTNVEGVTRVNEQLAQDSERQKQLRERVQQLREELAALTEKDRDVVAVRTDLENRLAQTLNNLESLQSREEGLKQIVAEVETAVSQPSEQ